MKLFHGTMTSALFVYLPIGGPNCYLPDGEATLASIWMLVGPRMVDKACQMTPIDSNGGEIVQNLR